MARRLKIAVNRHIINKIEKSEKAKYAVLTTGFENQEVTLAELAGLIDMGTPAPYQGAKDDVRSLTELLKES